MTDSIGLATQIIKKTDTLRANSMVHFPGSTKVYIGHNKGIMIFDSLDQKCTELKVEGNVTCITTSDELIFFCLGMEVMAVTTNGKFIYCTATNLVVDFIDTIHVHGYRLWLIAGELLSEFIMGGMQLSNKQSRISEAPTKTEDIHTRIFDIKINHSLLLVQNKPFLLLLKNNNQIETYNKKEEAQMTTNTPPTYAIVMNDGKVLVGCVGGEILCIEVDIKKIVLTWKLNIKTKINCILELKNGFMVARESSLDVYAGDRELKGSQEINEQITCLVRVSEDDVVLYGTYTGNVALMYDYEKMMKVTKERIKMKDKEKIIQEINRLRLLKSDLKFKTSNLIKPINIEVFFSIDYNNYYTKMSIVAQTKIMKIVIIGDTIVLKSDQQYKSSKYIINGFEKETCNILLQHKEGFHESEKIECVIMFIEQPIYASSLTVDLKHLSLHQKIESKEMEEPSHCMKISGEFKAFQVNTWLTTIFPDYNTNLESIAYESIVLKTKCKIQCKDKYCEIFAESPSLLAVVKKVFIKKAGDKQINFDVIFSEQCFKKIIIKIESRMKIFIELKREYELLPAIQEICDEELSQELEIIKKKSDLIKKEYSDKKREFEELIEATKEMCVQYRILKNKPLSLFQIAEIERIIDFYESENIFKIIDI